MRAAPLLLLLSLAASPVLAQSPHGNATFIALAPPAAHETGAPQGAEEKSPRTKGDSGGDTSQGDKNNQRAERIRIEDKGSRVDEVRIGGQTQSITVTPKVGEMPAYEVQPHDDPHNRNRSSSGTTGPRVWNMLKF